VLPKQTGEAKKKRVSGDKKFLSSPASSSQEASSLERKKHPRENARTHSNTESWLAVCRRRNRRDNQASTWAPLDLSRGGEGTERPAYPRIRWTSFKRTTSADGTWFKGQAGKARPSCPQSHHPVDKGAVLGEALLSMKEHTESREDFEGLNGLDNTTRGREIRVLLKREGQPLC